MKGVYSAQTNTHTHTHIEDRFVLVAEKPVTMMFSLAITGQVCLVYVCVFVRIHSLCFVPYVAGNGADTCRKVESGFIFIGVAVAQD